MSEDLKAQPIFSDVYLKEYTENNPHSNVNVEDDNLIIDKPWSRDDAQFKAPVKDQDFIDDLNNIFLTAKFDAIFHLDTNQIEFVFGYINPNSKESKGFLNRSFTVHFEGKPYKCHFTKPTERLYRVAKYFVRLPSDTSVSSVPQILQFKDAQNLDKYDAEVREYFEGKEPRSFFIESEEPITSVNGEALTRHINFLMSYYDRVSPIIAINQEPDDKQVKHKKPLRYIEDDFPDTLLIQPVDDIVLKLIEVAKTSQPRFSFLYYYQVFEYAGYYYIDGKAKRSLRNHLKDPALINCGEEKVSELFSIFADLNHNDDVKMKKVIEEHCDPSFIWKEIEHDKLFFAQEHQFDGGFTLKPLISEDTTENSWNSMWMPKLYDQLTKIRNSLVHARERRENKVILPSVANNAKLKHYLPLIERVAEQVALKS